MEQFKTVHGENLKIDDSSISLKVEHILQRYRDVWVVIENYPYLAIDSDRLNEHNRMFNKFIVFSEAMLFQNVRRDELCSRILSSLAGPGLDAGFSKNSRVLVEGAANQKANELIYFNDPLYIGCHAFAAFKTHYIYVDGENIYQREFAELISVDKHSRPKSEYVDFNQLANLKRSLHDEYFNGSRETTRDLNRLSQLLDEIFVENLKIHTAALAHHDEHAPHGQPISYDAPTLTRYGRLTHNTAGLPRMEISFALLHYEKAIREFNELKTAKQNGNKEFEFFHGVYCVVAVAACIEAIANKLIFTATSAHPDSRDKRIPIKKINDSAELLAWNQGKTFSPLIPGSGMYNELDAVRIKRNSFMHAKEVDSDIDPMELTSAVVAEVSENSCREYLRQLRLAVEFVYDQLSDQARPIVTKNNVRWMGDLEVP
ncbi:MAG: hypothetical protein ACXWTP_02250 [Methylosarcina sp.]